MVLSPDQERVKTLLKDTITLLCRNGLNFQATFCIDAVIGVTLDDSQLFYMSMNEVVKSEKALLRERQEQEGLVSSSPAKRRPDDKRHRHRKRVKRESADRDPGDSDVSQESYSSGDNDNEESFISQVKNELNDAANDDEDDSNDIVFIKQELDQQWPPSTTAATTQDSSADGAYYSGAGPSTEGYPDPPDFSSMNLVPVGGGDSWGGGGYPPHMAGRGRATPRTATATSPGDPQPGLSQQVTNGFACTICGVICSKKGVLKTHLARHAGKYPYYCSVCHKGCTSQNMLTGHMVTHTGKKEFRCSCGKEFIYRYQLKKHREKCAQQFITTLHSNK